MPASAWAACGMHAGSRMASRDMNEEAVLHEDRKSLSMTEALPGQLIDQIRARPLLSLAAAAAVGAAAGGLLLSRAGRLLFLVAAGYVVNGLWNFDGA